MSSITNLLFSLNILSIYVFFVYRSNILYLLIIGIGLLLSIYYTTHYKRNKYLICFVLMMFIFLLIKILYYQEISLDLLNDFLLFLSQIGMGLHLYYNINSNKHVNIVYYILLFIIFIYIINGINFREISSDSSQNYVNYIVLSMTALYIAINYKFRGKVYILPACISLFVSILSSGRSGILASLIMLAGLLFIKYKEKLNKFTMSVSLILFSVFSIYIWKQLNVIMYEIMYGFGTKDTFIKDGERSHIIEDYFRVLDIKKVVFGYDLNTYSFAGYTNLHNSFLSFHKGFGVIGILIIIVFIIMIIHFLVKKNYVFFLLVITLLLRSATDTVILVWVYDFIIIYFLINFFEEIQFRNKHLILKGRYNEK